MPSGNRFSRSQYLPKQFPRQKWRRPSSLRAATTRSGRKGQGQRVDFIAIDIYRVQNGLIAEDWHLEDNLTFLKQSGSSRHEPDEVPWTDDDSDRRRPAYLDPTPDLTQRRCARCHVARAIGGCSTAAADGAGPRVAAVSGPTMRGS